VPTVVLHRAFAGLRRGNGSPGAAGGSPAPRAGVPGRRTGDPSTEVPERATLGQLAAAVPGLREELVGRARSAALLVGAVAALVVPAWTVVDRVAAPEQAAAFLVIRLLADLPILAAVITLWWLPVGRRRPERFTFLVLAVVQLETAWMIPRSEDPHVYLLGYTIAIYVSGGVLVMRPKWTGRLIALSWGWLALAAITAPVPMAGPDLLSAGIYLGSASIVAMVAHLRRYALNNRELATRVSLEREQERTRVLLARLERLSQEDPLTGLANRRRWDSELAAACCAVREDGGVVSLVLVDIDHFKEINDRHGHAGGDAALQALALLLKNRVRAQDLVARLGGDELAVLLPGADAERALALAEALRQEAALIAPAGFSPGELTLSLGVATASGAAAFPLELIAQADQQLYRAKITRNAVAAPATDPAAGLPAPRPAPAG
jgi:diguanylate cyclase (GGDEF)-like protein